MNKSWIEDVEEVLRNLFDHTHIHHYKHWATGEELIDMDFELAKLVQDLPTNKKYMVFAKSAGTLLTLRAIKENKIHPTKCVFTGTAVNWGNEHDYPVNQWLQNYSVPTLFMQKEQDPVIAYDDLTKLLEQLNVQNYQTYKVKGSDHHYENLGEIKQQTQTFCSIV